MQRLCNRRAPSPRDGAAGNASGRATRTNPLKRFSRAEAAAPARVQWNQADVDPHPRSPAPRASAAKAKSLWRSRPASRGPAAQGRCLRDARAELQLAWNAAPNTASRPRHCRARANAAIWGIPAGLLTARIPRSPGRHPSVLSRFSCIESSPAAIWPRRLWVMCGPSCGPP